MVIVSDGCPDKSTANDANGCAGRSLIFSLLCLVAIRLIGRSNATAVAFRTGPQTLCLASHFRIAR
ncbi:MAG TPA: hypothetical protein VGC14_26715 [Rhizobium sp.]